MAYPATPKTWVAGDVLTAAQLNAELRDALLAAFPLSVNAWTAWTPTLTQPGAITKTVTYAKYQRVGRLIVAAFDLAVTGAGTAANEVLVGLPVTAAATGLLAGSMLIYDASTTTRYNGGAEFLSTTTIHMSYNAASGSAWGVSPSLALASGDLIRGTVSYEAAT